jgi:NAD-dependent dihydropyrimidine dehydrogenase PreA subunit
MAAVPVIASSCIACGDCRNACPEAEAIRPGAVFEIRPEACSGCGLCIDVCLTSSIYLPKGTASP